MTISGAVLTKSGVLCDQYYSFNITNIRHDNLHRRDVALAIMAIRKAVDELNSYYSKTSFPPPREAAIDGFPYFRNILDDKITFIERIGISRAFRAKLGNNNIVIKFCRRYSKEVHESCTVAPKLIHFQKV